MVEQQRLSSRSVPLHGNHSYNTLWMGINVKIDAS